MIHETSVRVRYGEVDRMGFVYHANYLPYFEIGRTEFLRSQGNTYRALEESGTLLVVADTGLRFLRPAGYDDTLLVRTRLVELSGVRIRFEYEIHRPADRTFIASGHTTLASTDLTGRPIRIPAPVRALLEAVLEAPPPAAGPDTRGEGAGKKAAAPGVQGRAP